MSESSYITILATLIGSVISIVSTTIISRHTARYSHQLGAKKESHEDASQPSNAETGVYARKIRRNRIALFLIGTVAFLVDAWFLWSLVTDTAPLTRLDAFWIVFYTLVTAYFGNRVMNDIFGNSELDQIMYQERAHRAESRIGELRDERVDLLWEGQRLLRQKVEELQAKTRLEAKVERGKNKAERQMKQASKKKGGSNKMPHRSMRISQGSRYGRTKN